ncbi:uncharacterized protein LOC121388791 isoform X2 [Gigantopelta aegis]|uniref:uncharacterized protein LOC121388791 isoform X2 n=1 Tax=Gigantopelta aegis TaxID=1735272 RepID=UPI001B88BAD2|nr:uncharacterized protein LOC121388791 isoform X2 [Gigantopelta aegis]
MRHKKLNQREGRKYRSYSTNTLTEAYFAVKDGKITVKGASRQFGIPEQTLRDRALGKIDIDCVSSGCLPVLTLDEEAKIVEHLKRMASYGYGYTRQEVIDIATDYAVKLGKRISEKPFTLGWLYLFIRRWPELRLIKPRALEQFRAKCTSSTVVCSYFDELENIITKYSLYDKPHLIFNVDEKGITQNHSPPRVVAGRDQHPQAVTSGKSLTTTIIGCGSASGIAIPPFFVFAGKRKMPELMHGASPGADCEMSDTGWSNSDIFRHYLQDHFIKFIPQRQPDQHLLLLLDGHKSHVSLDLVEWAKEKKIILFILPAHTSHILQPLDVACYGPLQKFYSYVCHKIMRQTSTAITRYNICELSCKVYSRALSAENLHAAFRKTGIFPLCRNVISNESVMPAEIYHNGQDNAEANDIQTEIPDGLDNQTVPTENVCTTTNKETEVCLSESPSAFLCQKIANLRNTKQLDNNKKPRRSLSKVVSGRPITESHITQKVDDYMHASGTTKPTIKNSRNSKNKSGKTAKKQTSFENCKNTSSPQPGPSTYNNPDSYSPSSDNSDIDIEESEKCCVCHMFTPTQVRQSISVVFTKWVQCDGCPHWVHLGYCTKERVIRLGDNFFCHHCVTNQSNEQ